MFNAANILEALKNYIRTRGGTSNAYNIAEAVNDLNSIPQGSGGIPEAPIDNNQYARKNGDWSKVESSGGDIPDEVTNAIETHGMGWTDTEEKAGFDIQWDGNTEGLDTVLGYFYKVDSNLYSVENLIGANMTATDGHETETMVLNEENILEGEIINGLLIMPSSLGFGMCIIAFDGAVESESGTPISKGVWFANRGGVYISRLYKEASTEEVVHQIDQKYIPQSSGGATVVHFSVELSDEEIVVGADKTPAEVMSAALKGYVVGVATIPNEEGPITMPLGSVVVTPESTPAFLFMGVHEDSLMYFIDVDEDNWVVNFA